MSPDARAICAAILSNDADVFPGWEGIAQQVAALETALAGLPPSDAEREPIVPSLDLLGTKTDVERGIRGMIPVGLAREWLNGARARVEAAQPHAAAMPMVESKEHPGVFSSADGLGDVLAYLGRCRQQLDSL